MNEVANVLWALAAVIVARTFHYLVTGKQPPQLESPEQKQLSPGRRSRTKH